MDQYSYVNNWMVWNSILIYQFVNKKKYGDVDKDLWFFKYAFL